MEGNKPKSLECELKSSGTECMQQEAAFAKKYKHASDEEIYEYIRSVATELGRPPTKQDVIGYGFIKNRLGPWPRVLEMAGVKGLSQRCIAKKTKQEALFHYREKKRAKKREQAE